MNPSTSSSIRLSFHLISLRQSFEGAKLIKLIIENSDVYLMMMMKDNNNSI